MLQNSRHRNIYIIITQTGTLLSRILKIITGAKYNHVSISLEKDLQTMYSFGRKNPYNPFWGGLVQESPKYGTFKRFHNTEAIVLEIPVEEETYHEMKCFIEQMYREKEKYHYNYLGLILAGIRVPYCQKDSYYCSEFVKAILLRFGVIKEGQLKEIIQPIHILELFSDQIIYQGKLKKYKVEEPTIQEETEEFDFIDALLLQSVK